MAGYAAALCRRRQEEQLYRVYVTEQLRLRNEGKYIPQPYSEWLNPPADYDADETIASVAAKLGLEVIE